MQVTIIETQKTLDTVTGEWSSKELKNIVVGPRAEEEAGTILCSRMARLNAKGWELKHDSVLSGYVGEIGKYQISIQVYDDADFPTDAQNLAKDAARHIPATTITVTPDANPKECGACLGKKRFIRGGRDLGPCFACKGTGEQLKSKEYSVKGQDIAQPKVTVPLNAPVLSKGIYTVVSPDGEYRTLKVSVKEDGKMAGKTIISYLCGADNENDYAGFAFFNTRYGKVNMWSRFKNNAELLDAANVLLQDPTAAGERYALASGCCWRCGRTLTVPASLNRGLGPECASKIGMM